MADHVNSCTRVFFADKDVKEQVLDLHPVPKDIKEAPIMDMVTQGILNKKEWTNTVSKDLQKIQSKIRNAYGPFAGHRQQQIRRPICVCPVGFEEDAGVF